MARTATEPAVTAAETISAVVVFFKSTLDSAPDPAAETPTPPLAEAILTPTPKASASITGLDSAVIRRSPAALMVPDSAAARTVLFIETVLRAAPIVTPIAAPSPSAMPSPAPPALESILEESVATTVTDRSVVILERPVMSASVSTNRLFVFPAPAPERATPKAFPFAPWAVPAMVQEVIEAAFVAATVRSPPASETVAPSMTAFTRLGSVAVPISLTAMETPTASETVLLEICPASAPATAKIWPDSRVSTVRLVEEMNAPVPTAAVFFRITVLRANEPAPAKDTGRLPIRLPSEPAERAPLTPTAQARISPPVAVSTKTAPPGLKTVAYSIVALTSDLSVFTEPAAPAANVTVVEAGIATSPETARSFNWSRAETVTPWPAEMDERFASVPVMAAVMVRPANSLKTIAAERAFSPEMTPLAAIVSTSALSVAATRTDGVEPEPPPAVTIEETIRAEAPPPRLVTSTAAPAESGERLDVNAVVTSEPATARMTASVVAVTLTEPPAAETVESEIAAV